MKKPDSKAVEQWFICDKSVESDEAFWQDAPFRTNGDVVEEIKDAIEYFFGKWQDRIKTGVSK